MLHAAEPFLERNLHPTVIIRGYVRALEDAVKIVDELAFPIDINDRGQMLKIIASCIGTKFTSRFGTLMPARAVLFKEISPSESQGTQIFYAMLFIWADCWNRDSVVLCLGNDRTVHVNAAPSWARCQGLTTYHCAMHYGL